MILSDTSAYGLTSIIVLEPYSRRTALTVSIPSAKPKYALVGLYRRDCDFPGPHQVRERPQLFGLEKLLTDGHKAVRQFASYYESSSPTEAWLSGLILIRLLRIF